MEQTKQTTLEGGGHGGDGGRGECSSWRDALARSENGVYASATRKEDRIFLDVEPTGAGIEVGVCYRYREAVGSFLEASLRAAVREEDVREPVRLSMGRQVRPAAHGAHLRIGEHQRRGITYSEADAAVSQGACPTAARSRSERRPTSSRSTVVVSQLIRKSESLTRGEQTRAVLVDREVPKQKFGDGGRIVVGRVEQSEGIAGRRAEQAAREIALRHGRVELGEAEGGTVDARKPGTCRQREAAWLAVGAGRGSLTRRQDRPPDRFEGRLGDGAEVGGYGRCRRGPRGGRRGARDGRTTRKRRPRDRLRLQVVG